MNVHWLLKVTPEMKKKTTFILNVFFSAFIMLFVYTSNVAASDDLKDIAIKFKDATSYYLLAQKYSIGKGSEDDYKQAIKWYREAAKLGHLKSKLKLGGLYFEGLGTEVNYDQAEHWLQEPAANGYNAAQYMLGMIYLKGTNNIKNDDKKAFTLLKLAADDFHRRALYQTGKLYFYGIGTQKNLENAKKYLTLASEQNIASATSLLAQTKFEQKLSKVATKPPVAIKKTKAELLEDSALAGNRNSQHKLATYLMKGSAGFQKDTKKAIAWHQNAADKGHSESQYILGQIYMEGKFAKRDLNKAKTWLSKASNNGDSKALLLLTLLKSDDSQKKKIRLMPKSKKELFLTAANKGDKEAQFNVGLMYLYGKDGFEQNDETALKWLKYAADQNHVVAQYQTGMFYYKPDSGNNQDAYTWLTKAAENGHKDAQYFLGTIYNQQHKYDKAAKWLDNAFLNNHSEALDLLVEMYLQGNLVNPDNDRLLIWLEKASQNGFRDAQFALGQQYLIHDEIVNNRKKAYAWIEKAARKGNIPAKYKLGMMLKDGFGVRRHYTKSARWLREAAKDGNPGAQYELAQLYNDGIGLPRSKNKAKKWYKAAAEQGHVEAKIKLGRDSRF